MKQLWRIFLVMPIVFAARAEVNDAGSAGLAPVYEFIYMDAATGKATSHCAEQPRQDMPLVAVACPPPQRR